MIRPVVLIGCALALCTAVTALAQVRVNGYFRQDGTYVQPHYRSAPDNRIDNNYSYPGNYNPYTGQIAPGTPPPVYTPPVPSYAPPTSLPSSGLYGLPRSK
jgi:hypothetical protein